MFVDVGQDAVDEAKVWNERIERLLGTIPPANTVPPAETRRARAEGRGIFGQVPRSDRASNRVVRSPSGADVPVRVILPEHDPIAVYLHIHGGGWTLGAADQHDLLNVRFADAASVAVVSVDYRLAPEDPYPAGPDDCEAAALWLLEHAADEFGVNRLLVGGESAGAHLSVVTMLRLRDRHGVPDVFGAANLVFGCYDHSLTPSARNWGERNLILSTPIVEWFSDNFLPGMAAEARRDPDVSPLYASLHDMPPALFQVGALDPLLDDSLFMAARWKAAGNQATLRVYPESPHGFHAFPTKIGGAAIAEQIDFVAKAAAG